MLLLYTIILKLFHLIHPGYQRIVVRIINEYFVESLSIICHGYFGCQLYRGYFMSWTPLIKVMDTSPLINVMDASIRVMLRAHVLMDSIHLKSWWRLLPVPSSWLFSYVFWARIPKDLTAIEVIIIVITRVAFHLAHSDTASITCLVPRLSRSDKDTPSTNGKAPRAARERRPQGLHAKFHFCILNSP